jgi:hypothetical protein
VICSSNKPHFFALKPFFTYVKGLGPFKRGEKNSAAKYDCRTSRLILVLTHLNFCWTIPLGLNHMGSMWDISTCVGKASYFDRFLLRVHSSNLWTSTVQILKHMFEQLPDICMYRSMYE